MVSRPRNTYDDISAAEIAFFSIYLIAGVYLCIKHGFGGAGFRFVVVLALARLIGSSMYLATLHDATNTDLYIGWAVTNGVGLGPLVLIFIGLLSRVFDNINRHGKTVLSPLYGRFVQILMLVAVIILIVGGTESNYEISGNSYRVIYNSLSRAGIAIMIVVEVLLIGQLALAWINKSRVPSEERYILPAATLCLPFITVRLVYSCIVILGNKKTSVWVYLGADVIMELIIVLIAVIVGFVMPPAPKNLPEDRPREEQSSTKLLDYLPSQQIKRWYNNRR